MAVAVAAVVYPDSTHYYSTPHVAADLPHRTHWHAAAVGRPAGGAVAALGTEKAYTIAEAAGAGHTAAETAAAVGAGTASLRCRKPAWAAAAQGVSQHS